MQLIDHILFTIVRARKITASTLLIELRSKGIPVGETELTDKLARLEAQAFTYQSPDGLTGDISFHPTTKGEDRCRNF